MISPEYLNIIRTRAEQQESWKRDEIQKDDWDREFCNILSVEGSLEDAVATVYGDNQNLEKNADFIVQAKADILTLLIYSDYLLQELKRVKKDLPLANNPKPTDEIVRLAKEIPVKLRLMYQGQSEECRYRGYYGSQHREKFESWVDALEKAIKKYETNSN